MSDFIKIDNKGLKDLAKDFKITKKWQIKQLQKELLNDEAKAVRDESKRSGGTIDNALTLRKGKWVKSSVLIDWATSKKMQSEVGSKFRWKSNTGKDFHGLGDAENGANISDPSIVRTLARISGLAEKNPRAETRKIMKDPVPINSSDPFQQLKEISAVEKSNPDKGFYIKSNTKKLRKGKYRFMKKKIKWKDGTKHRKIQMVSDESHSSVREKKRPWLKPAVKREITQQSVHRMYRERFVKLVKKWNKRR